MRCTGAVWLHSVVAPAMASPLYRWTADSVPPHCPVNAGDIHGKLIADELTLTTFVEYLR